MRSRHRVHHPVGVAALGASEARGAERTGALGGFRWTARLACTLPVRVPSWGRRGGWRETRSSSCTCVCYSLEELHSHVCYGTCEELSASCCSCFHEQGQ